MKNSEKNPFISFRTDLAYEASLRHQNSQVTGIYSGVYEGRNLKVIKTKVEASATNAINKKSGNYYTIDLSKANFHDTATCHNIELVLMDVLEEVITDLGMQGKKCLVIGLGNVSVTPDSLGPYVLDNVVVTRHLFKTDSVNEGYSEVSGFSPGVMGNTGIETFDIIKSVVDKIDVDYVIVVDALAAASIARVNRTIQVTDTGISPGSGVGNSRKEISYATLKKPVIAIGVPTVVDAVTIVSDAMDYMTKYLNQKITNSSPLANNLTLKSVALDYDSVKEPSKDTKEQLLGQIGLLNNEEKRVLIEEVLSPNGYNMMVTPKEVDADIEDLAKIIATSIDLALHPSIKKNYHKMNNIC